LYLRRCGGHQHRGAVHHRGAHREVAAEAAGGLEKLPGPVCPADAGGKTAIRDKAYGRGPDGGRLTPAIGGKPIWARFYEMGTDRPIFADRDKSIHDNVEELSRERRMGYNWYGSVPQEALDRYAQWSLQHPQAKGSRGN
jgi:hypothetical protein